MKMPENMSKESKIWFNRAMVYFHTSEKALGFYKEFNYIRQELGVVPKNEKENI